MMCWLRHVEEWVVVCGWNSWQWVEKSHGQVCCGLSSIPVRQIPRYLHRLQTFYISVAGGQTVWVVPVLHVFLRTKAPSNYIRYKLFNNPNYIGKSSWSRVPFITRSIIRPLQVGRLTPTTNHITMITTADEIAPIIEMVTVSEVPKIDMNNAVPKNSILSKMSLHFMEYDLQPTPKSEGQMVHWTSWRGTRAYQ